MEFETPEFKTRYLSQVGLGTWELIWLRALIKVLGKTHLPLLSDLTDPALNGYKDEHEARFLPPKLLENVGHMH